MSSAFNCNRCPYKQHGSDNHKQIIRITTDNYNVRVQFAVDQIMAEIQEHIPRVLVFGAKPLGRIACHSSTHNYLLVNIIG